MKKYHIVPALIFCLAMAFSSAALSQEGEGESEAPDCAAFVADVKGEVEFKPTEDDEWEELAKEECVYPGDIIRTGEESGVALQLGDDVVVRINASSDFQLWNEDEESDVPDEIDMELGELLAEMAPQEDVEEEEKKEFHVTTPSGVVAVRGTEFHVLIDEEGKTDIKVLDGIVEVFNDLGKVSLEVGMATEILFGKSPVEAFGFDIEEFNDYLGLWADGLSAKSVKKFIKKKVEKEVKKKILGGGGLF